MTFEHPFFSYPLISDVFLSKCVLQQSLFLLFLLDEPLGSESLRMIEAGPVMFMFTDSITMNVSPSKELIGYTAEFPPALNCNPKLFSALYSSPDRQLSAQCHAQVGSET